MTKKEKMSRLKRLDWLLRNRLLKVNGYNRRVRQLARARRESGNA